MILDNNFKLDHVSYAVRSTDNCIEKFKIIYPTVLAYKIFEQSQNVYVTYLTDKAESHKIELVEPKDTPNPVENILKKNNIMIYHTGYKVEDFDYSIKLLRKNNFIMITEPFKTNFDKTVWASHFYNSSFGIIEIMGNNNHG
tara:strand:- start:2331 stop:2756 length:426 start_codon:yes stop_codon:yes gene_type:complete